MWRKKRGSKDLGQEDDMEANDAIDTANVLESMEKAVAKKGASSRFKGLKTVVNEPG